MIDVTYLRLLKVHAVIPIVYCVKTKNINNMHSFVPAVMKRIGNAWEMLDDKEDELYETIPWSGDNGITNNGASISGIQIRSGAVILRGIENMRRRERSRGRWRLAQSEGWHGSQHMNICRNQRQK